MKMLVQRVKNAKVSVEGKTTGEIEQGFLVLLGIAPEDTQEIMEKMVDKLLRLRIFSDENDKINLSLSDVGGSLLLVSQFTLYADCRKGNRPSFVHAAPPAQAEALYESCMQSVRSPVYIYMDSRLYSSYGVMFRLRPFPASYDLKRSGRKTVV